MEIAGEQRIAAPREKVWAALNDPSVLKAAIPGCESLEQDGEDRFAAVVVAKVGPVKARFNGSATLSNIQAPESYTITGEGSGGVAGMAKGAADVRLEDQGDVTLLHYVVRADVGGKLAQVGSRLIEATAKKYAGEFFGRFDGVVNGELPVDAANGVASPAEGKRPASVAGAARPMVQAPVTDDPNVAHLRRLNWALLGLVALLSVGLLICGW